MSIAKLNIFCIVLYRTNYTLRGSLEIVIMKLYEVFMNGGQSPRRLPKSVGSLVGFVILVLVVNLGIRAEYRVAHCPSGRLLSVGEKNNLMLRQACALSYSRTNLTPTWTAYHMVAKVVGIATGLPRGIIVEDVRENTLSANEFQILGRQTSALAQLTPLVNFAGIPYWTSSNYATNSVVMLAPLASGARAGLGFKKFGSDAGKGIHHSWASL